MQMEYLSNKVRSNNQNSCYFVSCASSLIFTRRRNLNVLLKSQVDNVINKCIKCSMNNSGGRTWILKRENFDKSLTTTNHPEKMKREIMHNLKRNHLWTTDTRKKINEIELYKRRNIFFKDDMNDSEGLGACEYYFLVQILSIYYISVLLKYKAI